MILRPLVADDLAPLHALYNRLVALLPVPIPVGFDQFARELTVTRYREDENWDRTAELPLVACCDGFPVAFAHASFLAADARYSNRRAGTGVVRLALAEAGHGDALRALLREIIVAARARPELEALSGDAPLFHQCGAAGLSNAWPWIGRALVQEGFAPLGRPAFAMSCRLGDTPHEPLPLPDGAELRYDWVTRIGERDETEGGLHAFIGDNRAAESMWHFGKKYVDGAGFGHVHLFWLGTNPPYRGAGLGHVLLRESLIRAQRLGARTSDLRCNIDNFHAHALYRAEGYAPDDLLWSFRHRLGEAAP